MLYTNFDLLLQRREDARSERVFVMSHCLLNAQTC
jgi:hypothetical protein